MPGGTLGIKMGIGYEGNVSRTNETVIQPRKAAEDLRFGQAVILNPDNTYASVDASTVATDIAGVTVRTVKQSNTFYPQSNSVHIAGGMCDVLARGQITVRCQRGTPEAGGAVYVRIAENASYEDALVGGFEAASDGTNSVLVPNLEWTSGAKDTNDMAELTVKTRQKG